MTGAFIYIKEALSSLSTDQYVAIFIAIIAITLALNAIKKGLSIVFTVIGVLAAIYFVYPDLYYKIFEFLNQLFRSITTSF